MIALSTIFNFDDETKTVKAEAISVIRNSLKIYLNFKWFIK